jgi:hypothetical protein
VEGCAAVRIAHDDFAADVSDTAAGSAAAKGGGSGSWARLVEDVVGNLLRRYCSRLQFQEATKLKHLVSEAKRNAGSLVVVVGSQYRQLW